MITNLSGCLSRQSKMDLNSELKPPFSTTQETPEESLVNHFKICGTMKVTPAHFKDEGTILDSFKQSIELALCEICFQKMVYLLIQLLVYDFLDTSFKDSYNYLNSCIERMHKKYLSLIFRQIHVQYFSVVEAFFLNDDNQYLEVELCP